MPQVLLINGSPSAQSKTGRLLANVGRTLEVGGFTVERLDVRALPPADLLAVKVDNPDINRALAAIERADGVVIGTPIYKAAYTGLLKAFLDLLPQFALTRKTVLPLATGGTVAHVLAIDYALRPVLASLGTSHIVGGYFVLDKLFLAEAPGSAEILDTDTAGKLGEVVRVFAESVNRHQLQ